MKRRAVIRRLAAWGLMDRLEELGVKHEGVGYPEKNDGHLDVVLQNLADAPKVPLTWDGYRVRTFKLEEGDDEQRC